MGLSFIELKAGRPHLFGATPAQADMEPAVRQILGMQTENTLLALNLKGVQSVSGSYLRATVLWALLCGQAEAKQTTPSSLTDPWSLRPLPVFPVVTGCSLEVAEEVHDFFAQRNLPILSVSAGSLPVIDKGTILGKLDGFLAATLRALCSFGQATAAQLAGASEERITVNGWSNRLADLYALRLVTRQRSGKYWIYSPLAKKFTSWD